MICESVTIRLKKNSYLCMRHAATAPEPKILAISLHAISYHIISTSIPYSKKTKYGTDMDVIWEIVWLILFPYYE